MVRRMAISPRLSVTVITSVETKLNAATAMIKVRMMNIMRFSVCTAANQFLFCLVQSLTHKPGSCIESWSATFAACCISSNFRRKPDGPSNRNNAAASFQ